MTLLKAISGTMFAAIVVISAGCAVGSDDRDDDRDQPAVDDGTQAQSHVATPDELRVITPDATCKALKGVCTSIHICNEINHVHPIDGTGCPAGEVCCE